MSIEVSANDLVNISGTVNTWVDIPKMTTVINTSNAPALISVNIGGTSSQDPKTSVAAYRLLVDGIERTRTLMSYESNSTVVPVSMVHLETLAAGQHTVNVQWSGSARASVDKSTRNLIIAEL
jgi:hypothetical protein